MPVSEFALIRDYFSRCGAERDDVLLGVGDDAALLRAPAGRDLVVAVDTLVSGVHFLPDVDPAALGHKALAVNLSDLAAMGADPAWATLALTLPAADPEWLAAFTRGLCGLARRFGVSLVGGDTTRGPLTVSVQLQGFVPAGEAIRRSGARPGDSVFVTGTLGDAGLALRELLRGGAPGPEVRARLERPEPRVAVGIALRGLAGAAIDISDGLVADLGHLLEASGVGAEVELGALPLSAAVRDSVNRSGDWDLVLGSGDDYELCFTVPPERLGALGSLPGHPGCGIHRIGRVLPGEGLHCVGVDGVLWQPAVRGYDHFSGSVSPDAGP
jgi:thiamine-monophosphate kinase